MQNFANSNFIGSKVPLKAFMRPVQQSTFQVTHQNQQPQQLENYDPSEPQGAPISSLTPGGPISNTQNPTGNVVVAPNKESPFRGVGSQNLPAASGVTAKTNASPEPIARGH